MENLYNPVGKFIMIRKVLGIIMVCSEMDGGVHQICFNVDDSTKHFSKHTYQSEWSKTRQENHCMCLGAWALYKARQENLKYPKQIMN